MNFTVKQFARISALALVSGFGVSLLGGCSDSKSSSTKLVIEAYHGANSATLEWFFTDSMPTRFCISDNNFDDSNTTAVAYQVTGICRTDIATTVTATGVVSHSVSTTPILMDCTTGNMTAWANLPLFSSTATCASGSTLVANVTCNAAGGVRDQKTSDVFTCP